MIGALRRHWAPGLVVSLVAMATVVSALALAPQTYRATSVVAMVPRPEARVSADVLQLTIPTYATLASTPRVAADLAGRFQEDAEDVRGSIDVANPPGSNTVLLSASWSDPGTAADIANGLADEMIEAAATDPLLTASLVAAAVEPTEPNWPPRTAALVLGGLVALALGVAAAVFEDRRRPVVSTPAQVAAWVEEGDLQVPVLVGTGPATGPVAFMARAVEDRLSSYGGAGTPHVEVVDTGKSSAASVALAAGAAAALARHGRRVLLALSRDDHVFLGELEVARELALTATGQVLVGSLAGDSSAGDPGTQDGEADAVDVAVRLVRGVEHSQERTVPKSLVGVLALVAPGTDGQYGRAALESLAASGSPLLAVCYLVSGPSERATAPGRVNGGPGRRGRARHGGGPGRGRGPPSPVGTPVRS